MGVWEDLLGISVPMVHSQVFKEGLMSHLGQKNWLLGVRNIDPSQPLLVRNFPLEHHAILTMPSEGS